MFSSCTILDTLANRIIILDSLNADTFKALKTHIVYDDTELKNHIVYDATELKNHIVYEATETIISATACKCKSKFIVANIFTIRKYPSSRLFKMTNNKQLNSNGYLFLDKTYCSKYFYYTNKYIYLYGIIGGY